MKIIAVGNIKHQFINDGINNYTKQIKNISIIELPDEKDQNGLIKEGKKILTKIKSTDYVITLEILGKQLSSIELAKMIDSIQTNLTKEIVFVIGGSYGLSDEVKQRSDFSLSISKMTFPHQLTRLILLEQIYRAYSILNNHPYHK